ncbi:biotin-dependent carboxyltransferase family protein [Salirhabdus salicampi]|uniref:5-oxoprolinase subunit C family protein n=1 Tax=Salirhabdus salicampi TaxID=476102 RepID=UPI0020C55D3A|nr:biotin-dependent carboxyltransferase family protein [Salirhabdus salicampi]MCP8617839.1 biotin-dependent carboxyltransferase family protein [Salirhabdus salicampi]
MGAPLFRVVKPGLQTTIQDLGRYGYQKFGVNPSGVMDTFSAQVANILVGNKPNDAVIEATLIGPAMEALRDMKIAICGGDLSPALDGDSIMMWKTVFVKKGQCLSFGNPENGARAYISVVGGFNVPKVMGSRSTNMSIGFGGYEGRPLKKGDLLLGYSSATEMQRNIRTKWLSQKHIPSLFPEHVNVRVIPGPHEEQFTEEGIETFYSKTYTVSSQSNRMGYRLEGPPITHKHRADIISDATPFGGIQIPADGKPIILMADRQTTGGYTRIGTVISYDLPLLAQASPGKKITFSPITLEEAHKLYRNRHRFLKKITIGSEVMKY